MHRFLGVILAIGALSLAAPLFAPARAEAQGTGADAEARRLFQEGRTAYDEGRFEDSLRAFRRAYVMSNRFALLYNIGQTALRLGLDAEALDAFQAYLRLAPADDAHHDEVSERVRVLRTMVPQTGQTTATTTTTTEPTTTTTTTEPTTTTTTEPTTTTTTEPTTTTTTTTTTTEPTGGGVSPAPWILVGGGAAVAIVGGVLMGVASGDASAVTGAADGARWADLQPIADRASTMWIAGQVMLIAGAAILVGGLAWGIVDITSSSGSGERQARTRTRLRVGLGTLSVEGSF